MITRTRRNVVIALVAVLATSGLALANPTAALAVTCPTVDPVTFAVTPAASSGVDWSGCDLTGANLQDATLDGANLDGANLTDAVGPRGTFIGTNFTNATLTSFNGYLADFTGADFTGADLRKINFNTSTVINATVINVRMAGSYVGKSDFTGSTLSNITSGGITGSTASPATVFPSGWSVVDGILVEPSADCPTIAPGTGAVSDPVPGPNVNWSSCDLTGANLSGELLGGAQFVNATMTDANLTSATIIGANFTGANLLRLNLVSADATGAAFNYATGGQWGAIFATLNDCDFDHANVGYSQLGDATIHNANFNYGTLVGSTLDGAEFSNSTFASTLLSTANIDLTNFANVTFSAVSARGMTGGTDVGKEPTLPANWKLVSGFLLGPTVNLNTADLTGIDLTDVNLTDATMTDSTLTEATVTRLTLTGASLAGVTSGGIVGTPTALPTSWQLTSGYLIGPEANLFNADLSFLDLDDAILTGADLSYAYMQSASLRGADFSSANLDNATLTLSDLTNARLSYASLPDANFNRATMAGVSSGGISGTPRQLPTSWHLVNGYLLGQGADLTGAGLDSQNFSNYNLTDANFTGADVSGTNFTNAVLVAANFTDATAYDADFTRANLDGATMTRTQANYASFANAIMTSASVENATLDNANLTYLNGSDASFKGSSLENADLKYSSLYSADLTNASLRNATNDSTANLSAITWNNTTCIDGTNSDKHNGASCLNGLDTTNPTASMTAPTATFQSASSFTVKWSGSDGSGSGVRNYDVEHQKDGGTWTAWKTDTTGTSATYPGTATAGARYCFRATATDKAGRTSSKSSSKCTVVPIDDHSLSKSSGWSSSTSASGYLNRTYYSTTSSNKYLITSSKSGVRQVSVLALKCSSCGSVAVYVGSTKIGTYSLKKSGSSARGLVTTARFSSKSGKVKVVSTISGKTVRIDGVGISTS